MARKAERIPGFDHRARVENTHHQLFAKSRGHAGKAHLHLVALRIACFDAPILRAAALHHIHARQQFDARRHGRLYPAGNLVHGMQYAVDAKTHHRLIAARLQMDITGTLLKRVLPQPIHQLHHALVVGIEILVLAQINQLLEIGDIAVAARFGRGQHRFGQGVKLGGVACNLQGTAHHQLDFASGLALNLANPIGLEWLGRSYHHLLRRNLNGQHLVALGIGQAHGIRHPAQIRLERVNAQIWQVRPLCQKARQVFNIKFSAIAFAGNVQLCQPHQRVLAAFHDRTARHDPLVLIHADHAIKQQPFGQPLPIDRARYSSARLGKRGRIPKWRRARRI